MSLSPKWIFISSLNDSCLFISGVCCNLVLLFSNIYLESVFKPVLKSRICRIFIELLNILDFYLRTEPDFSL